ncbi:MAG: hypothetical protein NUV48_02950 [Peptococcaceae bacterium]|jgi:hypothetical protein|nr:hypothetical protein [Peptococcaceae bacterium]
MDYIPKTLVSQITKQLNSFKDGHPAVDHKVRPDARSAFNRK